jgi:hypothetical protein
MRRPTPHAEIGRPSSRGGAELLAADAIGDVIEHWGFRKALGRVWTVLYLPATPLPAAELAERLQMSAGAVSMALTELSAGGSCGGCGGPGERKEFYEAETDFWKMISKVVTSGSASSRLACASAWAGRRPVLAARRELRRSVRAPRAPQAPDAFATSRRR